MKRKGKSLKQKWVFERMFHNAGQLSRIRQNLRLLQAAASTLPEEKTIISRALLVLKDLDTKEHKMKSWNLYKERRKK